MTGKRHYRKGEQERFTPLFVEVLLNSAVKSNRSCPLLRGNNFSELKW